MAEKNPGGHGPGIPKALKWIWSSTGAGSHDDTKSSGTPAGQKKKDQTKPKPTKKTSPAQGKASPKKPADTVATLAATDTTAMADNLAAKATEAGRGQSSEESQPPQKPSEQGETGQSLRVRPGTVNLSGSVDVPGRKNVPAATTGTDPVTGSPPQALSDKAVSAQSELEKKVDASVSSFVEGENPTGGAEEPLNDIKKDIVASLKELENSEDADPVLLAAADTAASLIAANPPEVDQNPDDTAESSEVKEEPIEAATASQDGLTKSLQAKKDSDDTPAAPSDQPKESTKANEEFRKTAVVLPSDKTPESSDTKKGSDNTDTTPLKKTAESPEAKETQSDAAVLPLGKPSSLDGADVSPGNPADTSANPATPNEVSKETDPAPLDDTADEAVVPGPLGAANKETVNAVNSDATAKDDGPAGLGPKAQKPPVPKILIEAASDATDDDPPPDIPHIQTVPRAVPSVSALPPGVIPAIAENADEPETPKLRKRKLYIRKMRNIALQKPILDAALGRQLGSETKRILELLAKGEPYGLNSEAPDVADPVDAAPGAMDAANSAEVDRKTSDPAPGAADAIDSSNVAEGPIDSALDTSDATGSDAINADAADPSPSAADAPDSPEVAANTADPALATVNTSDSAPVAPETTDSAPAPATNSDSTKA
ncbi:hypothetical protein MMC31_002780 [Peltigera leucophlebia]|nr:hypothetical protein [Peltigera leucophlebia]